MSFNDSLNLKNENLKINDITFQKVRRRISAENLQSNNNNLLDDEKINNVGTNNKSDLIDIELVNIYPEDENIKMGEINNNSD